MALSEIEKLERRYAENPQGLTFAPLAEVHRKNGEVQRALDLLGPGLQIHPDYIPASIVLGRCHMDLGDVHSAETAFLHVLDLDGENVIALKALADISERLLKFDDAEHWLHTLLTLDRSNDEAREQLQRVEIARRQAGVASSAEPSSLLETPPDAEAGIATEPAVLPIPDIAPSPPPFQPPAPEPAGSSMGFEDLEPSAMRDDLLGEPSGVRSVEPPRLEEPVEPLDGLVGREVEPPGEAIPPFRGDAFGGDDLRDNDLRDDDLRDDDLRENDFRTDAGSLRDEFRVETSEDIVLQSAGGSEFQMPDASQELFASGARGERAPFEEDAPPPSAERVQEPEAPKAPEPIEELPEPEPFVYEAPRAEQIPVAPEPPAPEPSAAEPVQAPPVAAAQPAPTTPKRAYGVGDTGGRSINQLFKNILAARPPMQASAAPVRQAPPTGTVGAPTRPAADALSLSSVFGEEGSETPPAVPAPSTGAGSVTFDDFFGSPSASPAARTPRAPDPKNDDLDQFHAWLQNLKR